MKKAQIIALINAVVPKRSTLPIIENVYLNGKELIVTDLENTVIIPFKVPGINICVPADKFIRVIQTMESFTAKQFKNNKVTFRSKGEEISVTGEDADQFPAFKVKTNFENGKLLAKDFATIKTASLFVSHDELRPSMMNVLVGKFICGTDGHQLHWEKRKSGLKKPFLLSLPAIKILSVLKGENFKMSFIVDRKARGAVIENGSKPSNAHTAVFHAKGGVKIITRLTVEQFPNYLSVIPGADHAKKETAGKVKVPSEIMIATLKRALEYAHENTKQVRVNINGKIEVKAMNLDMGHEYRKSLDHKGHTGSNILIGMNGEYFKSAFEISPAVADIQFFSPNTAVIFNGNHLVMPVRLND